MTQQTPYIDLVAAYAAQYLKQANTATSRHGQAVTFSVTDETHDFAATPDAADQYTEQPSPADQLAPMMEIFDIIRGEIIEARNDLVENDFPKSMADLMAQETYNVILSLMLASQRAA